MPLMLKDQIYNLDPPPRTYDRYKRVCSRLYPIYKEKLDRQRAFRARQASQNTSGRAPATADKRPSSNPSPQSSKGTSQPSTFRPRGFVTPEERERRRKEGLCYRCGQKGHIATKCPIGNSDTKPKVKNTALETTLEEGVENETKTDQIQENPRNGQGRSAAIDTDEDTPRFGRSRYAALEDFQAAQS